MSQFKPSLLEEDSRSCEGKVIEPDEEGFYSFRDEDSSSPHLTWSTFEDLDDSGHFTASPDGERTFSGSSRSHSPCPNSAHLLLQMQQHQDNLQFQQPLQLAKPLISPRSIMTVKVPPPQNNANSFQIPTVATMHSGEECESENRMNPSRGNSSEVLSMPPCSMQQEIEAVPPISPLRQTEDVSMKLQIPCGGRDNDESSEYLRSILDNFNTLYMEKLRMIDDLVTEGNEEQKKLLMEKKTSILENWAKDVCIQNMVLVHTVEELEREANRKVTALQQKMSESTHLAKEHMTMIKKYEQQVKLLLKNHSDTEEKNLVLKIELEKLKSECRRVRDRMNLLLKDSESLVTLVCRIRDMGVWDVSGLELQRSSFDQIFGLYPNLAGSEVQTVFTRQKAQHVKETEAKVEHLEKQLEHLQKSQTEDQSDILLKDRKIGELETQIKNLSNKVQYCEQECNDYKRSLLETQEKLLEATRRLTIAQPIKSSRPSTPAVSEMTELIRELRDVKSQLNTAVEEKQTAKEESNYFKKELGERLKEMHDIQNVFQSLATEVVSSRAAFQQVREKEVQLESLKSEIHTYQSRCADADDTIRKKDTEIKQLQKQMNKLHKKIFELEDEWGKVFANFECNMNPNGPVSGGDTIAAIKSSGSSTTTTDDCKEQSESSSVTELTMESHSQSYTTAPRPTSTSKEEHEESIQELLERLAREKREMEERYQKELQDKDIEIKMQKVTIQHLQDAYVALKRGQPIPIPQNVTGNGIIVNGSSNGHSILSNHVMDV